MSKFKNIELRLLTVGDFEALKTAAIEAYGGGLNPWKEKYVAI